MPLLLQLKNPGFDDHQNQIVDKFIKEYKDDVAKITKDENGNNVLPKDKDGNSRTISNTTLFYYNNILNGGGTMTKVGNVTFITSGNVTLQINPYGNGGAETQFHLPEVRDWGIPDDPKSSIVPSASQGVPICCSIS